MSDKGFNVWEQPPTLETSHSDIYSYDGVNRFSYKFGKHMVLEYDFYDEYSLITTNELITKANELDEFKKRVFDEIDKRINTLKANSKQCHQGGSHDKGIEFTLQAELLERLRDDLQE